MTAWQFKRVIQAAYNSGKEKTTSSFDRKVMKRGQNPDMLNNTTHDLSYLALSCSEMVEPDQQIDPLLWGLENLRETDVVIYKGRPVSWEFDELNSRLQDT